MSTVATDVTDEPQLASESASTDTLIVYGAAVESNWPMARYDLSTGSTVLAQFQGGGPGDCVDVTLSPDQAHIEVTCGDAVSEFDSSTLQLDGTQYRTDNVPPNALAATAMHGGVLVSDAEQFSTNDVYIDRIGGGTLRLYELNNDDHELESSTFAGGIALSPDGHRLYDVAISNSQFGGPTGPTLVRVLRVP